MAKQKRDAEGYLLVTVRAADLGQAMAYGNLRDDGPGEGRLMDAMRAVGAYDEDER